MTEIANPLEFMERGSVALGLRLCFHDLSHRARLPLCWEEHANAPCLAIKANAQNQCAQWCGGTIHQKMLHAPTGSIQRCPFGYTEITMPVRAAGVFAGVLFAGPCWCDSTRPPHDADELTIVTDRQWLEDKRLLLRGLAHELGYLLCSEAHRVPTNRQTMIHEYILKNIDQPIRLDDLASVVHLSPSRTGHLVKELFGLTVPALIRTMKMERAARLLRATDLPVGRIAAMVGYDEQSHFTRHFKRQYDHPPQAYRRDWRSG